MDKRYLANLDFLRVIAAYFVMLFHFNWEGDDPLSRLFAYGYMGVSVFFCISGFITPLAMRWSGYCLRDWRSFLVSRFFRLYPAFAVIALFEIFLYANGSLMGYGYKFDQITFYQFMTNFTWTAELCEQKWFLPVFWTLAIEAQFTLLILFVYPLLNHRYEAIRVLPLVLLIALNYYVGRVNTIFGEGDTIFHYMAVFGMGMSVYLYFIKRIRVVTLVFLLAFAYFSYAKSISSYQALTSLCTACLMLIRPQLDFKIVPYLGKFAYSFFLVHITFGGAASFHMRFFPDEWYFQFLRVLIAGVVSFFAAWVFYYKVELPSHEYARKLKHKKRS